jgi:ERCC4-type nuclease
MARNEEEPVFIVAPTERHHEIHGLIGEHGEVSMLPERYGCDVLWRAKGEWWGVQRKELSDFIASVQDGRLAREIAMMKSLPMRFVIIEGKIQYTSDDELMFNKRSQRIQRNQFYGMQLSLMAMGVDIIFSHNHADTARWCRDIARWSMKDGHKSLLRRPGPVSVWGTANDEDWALHLLQGFDGLGIEKCKAIMKHFGGVPMDWSCTEEQLMEVPGIGKTLARRMINALTRVEPHE